MPYYTMGDYYGRGDYYRGDPGILGSIVKTVGQVAKGVVRLGAGYVTGGPSGVAKALQQNYREAMAPVPTNLQPPMLPFQLPPPPPLALGPGTAVAAIPPGVVTQSPYGTPVSMVGLAKQGVGVKGFHPNKSTYVSRGGGTSRWGAGLQLHPKGSVLVKSRRMNVANAHALRRSLRRVAGFAKIVKRSRRAIARAASAVGVRRGVARKKR